MVAPTISRTLMPMHAMSMHAMALHAMAMEHACMPHGSSHPMPAGDPLSGMDTCGYCSFFSHTPMASGSVPALPIGPLLPASAPVQARVERAYAGPLLQARSRGPPSTYIG